MGVIKWEVQEYQILEVNRMRITPKQYLSEIKSQSGVVVHQEAKLRDQKAFDHAGIGAVVDRVMGVFGW